MFTGGRAHPAAQRRRNSPSLPSATAPCLGGAVHTSGDRGSLSGLELPRRTFTVDYRIQCDPSAVEVRARELALEQTAELPRDLVPDAIAETMVGRVESVEPAQGAGFRVRISYPVETAGGELTQFLNVVFGNASLQPNARVEELDCDPSLLGLGGPRFGATGVRRLAGVESRPLLATALKPMGLDVEEMASLAYKFARGGIDIIKDDHGVTNQSAAPFRERVIRCAEAVQRANRETQGNSLYVPNVSADFDELIARAELARDAGAGGLLAAPGLIGFGAFRALAARDDLGLPMMSHPAFLGGWLTSPSVGISHRVLLGTLQRLAGADMVIFPHLMGRFSFSLADCTDLTRGLLEPKVGLRPSLPVPAGGMDLSRVSELVNTYGPNVVLLVGGALFRHGTDLEATARLFRRLVDESPIDSSRAAIPDAQPAVIARDAKFGDA